MDSTLIHQLPAMVSNLGTQARFVLVWYFALRFGVHILWACVLLVVVSKALGLVKFAGNGARLNRVVQSAAGMSYPNEQHYVAAEHAILEALEAKEK